MSSYDEVFEKNRAWVSQVKATQPDFFAELSKGQSPDFLFIGCADSRVPATQVMGLKPGDAFVHRNVANLVLHTDVNIQSVIEYAVTHLKVKHVVVCGHYGCGGVQAAMGQGDFGTLNPWLREIKDVYDTHRGELEALDADARYTRLVELNAIEQCRKIVKTPAVQTAWALGTGPSLHAWVYNLGSGLLKDLGVDFEPERQKLASLYKIGTAVA